MPVEQRKAGRWRQRTKERRKHAPRMSSGLKSVKRNASMQTFNWCSASVGRPGNRSHPLLEPETSLDASADLLWKLTTDWRAECQRLACSVRREGRPHPSSLPLSCSPRPVTRERAPYRARQGRSRGSVPPTVLARAGHAGACPLPCSPGSGQASITDETSVLHFQANGFHFGVIFEDFAAHLAAPSGLFISAKRERGVKDVIAVDPARSGFHCLGHPMRLTDIFSPDGSCESVSCLIHLGGNLVNMLERHCADDGSKDFLVYNLHSRSYVREQRRLNEITVVAKSMSANHCGGALLFACFDKP